MMIIPVCNTQPGKVYGEILSGGKNPTVSIRENLLFYGAGVALLLAHLGYWGGFKCTEEDIYRREDVQDRWRD